MSDEINDAAEVTGDPDPEWLALLDRARAGGDDAGGAVCEAYSRGIQVGIGRAEPNVDLRYVESMLFDPITVWAALAPAAAWSAHETLRSVVRSLHDEFSGFLGVPVAWEMRTGWKPRASGTLPETHSTRAAAAAPVGRPWVRVHAWLARSALALLAACPVLLVTGVWLDGRLAVTAAVAFVTGVAVAVAAYLLKAGEADGGKPNA